MFRSDPGSNPKFSPFETAERADRETTHESLQVLTHVSASIDKDIARITVASQVPHVVPAENTTGLAGAQILEVGASFPGKSVKMRQSMSDTFCFGTSVAQAEATEDWHKKALRERACRKIHFENSLTHATCFAFGGFGGEKGERQC